MSSSAPNSVHQLKSQIARFASTLIVLAWWFVCWSSATAVATGIVDSLLIWMANINLGWQFCRWFGTVVGPYESLIDPLPFYFFVGINGGALAVLFKIRALMSRN